MPADLLSFNKREKFVHLRNKLTVAAQDFANLIDAYFSAIHQSMCFSQAAP